MKRDVICYLPVVITLLLFSACSNKMELKTLDQIEKNLIKPSGLIIHYPQSNTVFPPEFPSPEFFWTDSSANHNLWHVFITGRNGDIIISGKTEQPSWRPDSADWQMIKNKIQNDTGFFVVISKDRIPSCSSGRIGFTVSKDSIGADIFYRSVTLPFGFAVRNLNTIEWYLGSVKGGKPKKMLDNMPVCANCHSFNANGSFLAMDVDYGNDKGSYAIASTHDTSFLTPDKIITWSDYKREEGDPTFGLLSQISPDGRYILSTIKDFSVFVALDNNLKYSQLFFPVKGIIGIYNREDRTYTELSGANDRKFVQSNPSWSPDGKKIVFAKTNAYVSRRVKKSGRSLLSSKDIEEFFSGGKQFKFDLYKIDFNDGHGGKPDPLEGASANGMSNYFARYSPDGKWIVFCRANNFMLLQPDSKLYIMPADGGNPRLMTCNLDSMNSWHSWSPNSKWLVFSSKHRGLYTQLYITHIDENGNDSPPVFLENLVFKDRAANIPEFFPGNSHDFKKIKDAFSHTAPSYAAVAADNILNKYYKRAWNNLLLAVQTDSNYIDAYFTRITLNAQLSQSNSIIDRSDKNKVFELVKTHTNGNDKQMQIIHATMLAITGKSDEAIKETRNILKNHPNDYKVYDLLASEYRNTKQYEKAFPCYEKMMQLSPANTFQIKNYFSSDYFALGKFEKSLQILNQLIAENPFDYDLLVNRANLYIAMNNFDAAKKDCDVLINKDNSSYKYYQLRAQVYLKKGNKALALADYKKALELINKEYDRNKEDVDILFDRAEQNKILGNDLDAMADYDKVLLLFPGNYKALVEKVRFVLLQKDWARAIGYYDQLIQNYPPEEEFYNNQAIAYLNLGDYDNALVKFNKTIELNQQNCDALYNRSKLYKMMGNEERSKDDLKKIILILDERKRNGKVSNDDLEWLNRLKRELLS